MSDDDERETVRVEEGLPDLSGRLEADEVPDRSDEDITDIVTDGGDMIVYDRDSAASAYLRSSLTITDPDAGGSA